jgi:histone-lysine N-methyltransferase SETMAR
MKKERLKTCKEFLEMVRRHLLSMLDNIITVDNPLVFSHTPEMKQQSKQRLEKNKPGPIKPKVHATRTKQMGLVFFESTMCSWGPRLMPSKSLRPQ